MNRNQIAVINSLPATPVQRQTRSGALYAGTPPADAPQANVRRCRHCRQPREGHDRSGCPNVDPPIPPVNTPSRNTKPRPSVSNPGYNVINQQQVNINLHYHASPHAPLSFGLRSTPPEESDYSDSDPPSPSTAKDPSQSGDSAPSEPPNDDRWDTIDALLRAQPDAVVTLPMSQDDLAAEELAAKKHGYAVKVVYPEDSQEGPNQGLFILARDAATLRGTYSRARKAVKSGTSLATIAREESHRSFGDAVQTVVDAMAGLDVGGPKPQGSRKPRKSRKKTT